MVPGGSDPRLLQLGQRALHLNRKDPFVAEQIDETDIRKIPQIVWVESASFNVTVYLSVYCQPPYEIHLLVDTTLVLFPWSLQ